MTTEDLKPGYFSNSITTCIEITPKAHQMIRKVWIFTLSVAIALTLTQRPAIAQYGPPTSGSSAAILFTPATVGLVAGLNGQGSSGNGGLATAAKLNYPVGIAYDSSGNLFIADSSNYVVRRIDHVTGDISIFAGTGTFGNSLGGGVATSAQLGLVNGLVLDTSNNVYVTDRSNNLVWKITPGGTISVYAGGGSTGLGDGGLATAAELDNPWALGIDASNNIYISDSYHNLVREVNYSTNIITTFAGDIADITGCSGAGLYSTSTPPYTPIQAHLCFPEGVAFDSSGNAYIVDASNAIVRVVNKSTGYISTFAGGGTQASSVNGIPATSALLSASGVFVDPANRVYIASSNLVRVVDSSGNINTVFGTGGGDLTSATLGEPDTESVNVNIGDVDGVYDMAMDTFGNLLTASSSGNTILTAGTTGQYVFPQTQIFTTETTTQENAFSSFYPPYITVSNPSGVTLNFTATPVVTGPFAVVTGAGAGTCVFPSGSVAPGQSCTIVVSFTPTLGGSPGTVQTGTVVLASNANSAPSTILLSGTGTGIATVSATLTPSPLTYTSVAGVTSASQNAVLTNTGQLPIAVGSTDFNGFNPTDFAVSTTTCPTGAATVAVGSSCTYSITFTPPAATGYQAGFQVCVTTSSYGCLQSIVLQGTGTAGATATLLPTPLAFGNGIIGQTSATLSATLSNTSSTTAITISSFGITGTNAADFAVSTGTNACGSTLAANSSCIVYVTFTPASAASFSAQLSVTDSATGSPQTVALTGTGISFVSNVGTALAAQAVTVPITTAGTPATINVLTIGVPNLDFTLASGGTCSTSTAYTVGQTCTVNVVFTPRYPGARNGAIVLTNSGGTALGTTYLPGTGIGPEIAFTPSPQITVPFTGLIAPSSLAVDGAGDVFVSDTEGNHVLEITPGGTQTTVGTGLGEPDGLAVDGAGNLFISNYAYSVVLKVTPNGTQTTVGTGFVGPAGLAVDGAGDLFIADNGSSPTRVVKITPSGTQTTVTSTGLNTPYGIAVDAAGDVFIADSTHVFKVTPSGTQTTVSATGLDPLGVAVDAAGDLFITYSSTTDHVVEVAPSGTQTTLPISGLAAPGGIAVDGAGDLFVTNGGTGQVLELQRSQPSSYTFSTTNVGSKSGDSPNTVAVSNIGNASLTLSANPSYPTNFPVNSSDGSLCSSGTPLAQGTSCDVSINFIPTASGPLAGNVVITDNNLNVSGATQSIAVSGTGTGAPAPIAGLAPNPLAFSSTTVGSTATALPVTLSNTGTASLTGIAATLTGTNPTDFAITSAGTCGTTLAATSTCTIYVSFTPVSATSFTATLSIADNATGSPQTVTLTGTGTAALTPLATLSPNPLAFPSTTINTAATSLPITLSNPGTAALTISSIAITGANTGSFSQTNNCGASLAATSTCTITVGFTPAATGGLTASITVTDNATGSPQSVTLTGTGAAVLVPQATLAPSSLTFPSTTVGVAASTQPITLSNPGTAALAITSISVTGTNTGSFGQTNTCGSSLAAGSSCTITVSFTPAAAGSLAAAISVVDNATGSPQSVAITGTGAAVVSGSSTFTVATTTPTATIQPGGVAQYNLVIAPFGGTYNNLVTLSATGLPSGAQASFLPAAVTPGSAGAPSVMSIQTSTGLAHLDLPGQQRNSPVPLLAMLAGLPLLGFAGNLRRLRRCRGRWMLLGLATLAILPLLALSGCGGGYFGPAPKTYTVTVVGTSGVLQQSTTVSLTVQ